MQPPHFTQPGAGLYRVLKAAGRLRSEPRSRRFSPARLAVLGSLRREPGTVSDVARRLASARQGVQRLVDALVQAGLLEPLPNPRHRRAPLFALTAHGREDQAEHARAEALRFNQLAEGLAPEALRAAAAILEEIYRRQQRD